MPENEQEFSLAEVIKTMAHGRFHDEATQKLQQLVVEMNRVADNGGGKPKGSLSLTIKFTLDRGILELDPSLKVTSPATVRARTIMYADRNGRLSKNDMRQGELSLSGSRDVSTTDVLDIRNAPSAAVRP